MMELLSPWAIALVVFVVGSLGVVWVVGASVVKRHSPEHLPHFYMIIAVVRILILLTMIGGYIFLLSDSKEESKVFALFTMAMYVLMMVITLKIKH